MGTVASHINNISFNLMDYDSDPNKELLIFAFKEGCKYDADLYDNLSKEVNSDGSLIGKYINDEKLEWPMCEDELIAEDGFLSKLTE